MSEGTTHTVVFCILHLQGQLKKEEDYIQSREEEKGQKRNILATQLMYCV